ncbi:Uncharacterised protein [uncultured archaeon]|nr:Uncharacterised protein [uncultured archaeon]
MKQATIAQLGAGTAQAGGAQGSVPMWMTAFEKDIDSRLKKSGHGLQPAAPSAMTMTAARMAQNYAQTKEYDNVLKITSLLARDPDAASMLSGEQVHQVIAQGLFGLAHKVASDSKCSYKVQKTILLHVLGLLLEGGQRQALVDIAKKPSTPQKLASAAVALFAHKKDRDALAQIQEMGHDGMLAEFARRCVSLLDFELQKQADARREPKPAPIGAF